MELVYIGDTNNGFIHGRMYNGIYTGVIGFFVTNEQKISELGSSDYFIPLDEYRDMVIKKLNI